MSSSTSNPNQNNRLPPKNWKNCKINDARESLGEFESSMFDASDGHKLVDLIRKKKGLHVQTQKIFDDVPTQRPSLQIEIQRLDDNNDTLRPEESASAACINSEAPPKCAFVPHSPRRISTARLLTSPIVKMNSIKLGRRTLLKEFEKANLHESRFLPQTCSTPITSDCPGHINETITNGSVKEPCAFESRSSDTNIITEPIIISSEGSSAQPPINCSNPENTMRSLIQQNDLLNALAQSDHTTTNKENPIPKSPGRIFTFECDISSGKITLSPGKSSQNHERHPLLPKAQVKTPKKITKKLIATPEQRKVLLSRLGIGKPKDNSPQKVAESAQKTSRIPILSKATPMPSLANQQTATAEFVEHLQKNSNPNCPVIIIPVNQTFNQAPNSNTFTEVSKQVRSPPADEITSTISDNAPQICEHANCNADVPTETAARVESPASNGISSTTISNFEALHEKVPEPPTSNLRWTDIITDDSSSLDTSDRSSALTKTRARKLSKKQKSQKHHSTATCGNKKLSPSYKSSRANNSSKLSRRRSSKTDGLCGKGHEDNLPQRSRNTFDVEQSAEEYETDLPQPSQRDTSKMGEQRHEQHTNILSKQFQRKTFTVEKHCDEDPGQYLSQRSKSNIPTIDKQRDVERSRRDISEIDERRGEQHRNNLLQRKTFTIDKQREQNLSQESQSDLYASDKQREVERETNLLQRSQRHTSKINEQRAEQHKSILSKQTQRKTFTIDEQRDEEREQNLSQKSLSNLSRIDKQPDVEQSKRDISDIDERRDEQRRDILSQRKTFTIDEQREQNLSEESQSDASTIDFLPEINLPQRSQRNTSNMDDQGEQRTNILSKQSQRKTFTIDKQREEQERKQNLSQRSQSDFCAIDKQRDVEREPQRSQRESSKINEQRDKQRKSTLSQQSQRKTLTSDEQRDEERQENLSQHSQSDLSAIDKPRDAEPATNLSQRSRLDISKVDRQLDRLKNSIQGKNNDIDILQIEVLLPPDEFCDRDVSSNCKSASFEKDELVDELSSDKISLEKLERSAKVNGKKKRSYRKVPQHVKQYLEANKKVSKSKFLNVSKRKLYSKGNSDASSSPSNDSTPEKVRKRNAVSPTNRNSCRPTTQAKLPNKPRKSNKSSPPLPFINNNNSERNETEEITRNSSTSTANPANSTAISPAKNSRQTNEHHNKGADINLEEDNPTHSSSRLHSSSKNSIPSPVKTSKQSKEQAAIVDIPAPPTKTLSKNKKTKKTKSVRDPPQPSRENEASATSSTNIENNCGLRRSSRKTKPPSAYWSCPNSQFTHANDIYYMLTAGKKKPYFPYCTSKPNPKKKKDPSNDDNLVANTNTVESSSEKNTCRNTKQKNKKKGAESANPPTIPEATASTSENREFQSDFENELQSRTSESEPPQMPKQVSTTERQTSNDTTSHSKTKANKKTTKNQIEEASVNEKQDKVHTIAGTHNINNSVQLSTNSSSADSSQTKTKLQRTKTKKRQQAEQIQMSSSDCPSEDDNLSFHRRRLETIAENFQEPVNPLYELDTEQRLSASLMPPPVTSVVKKGKKSQKKNAFHTEHDKSIADVSSVHLNNLFDQLKNSSMNSSKVHSSRVQINSINSSGQASSSARKLKNVRLQRMRLPEGSYDVNEKNFDSGFSSEDMNSINPKKDILLDWLVQMVHSGRTPTCNQKGLARLLKPNGYNSSRADELIFEEIDGVDFAFYNSKDPGQKFGYLRFKPKTHKKTSCAKRYELNFVLLGGTIKMTVNNQSFDMRNGDLTTIFIGTSYRMENLSDDPALVMVIKS